MNFNIASLFIIWSTSKKYVTFLSFSFFSLTLRCRSYGKSRINASFLTFIFQFKIMDWQRLRGRRNGELVFNGHRVPIWEGEKVLEMDGVDIVQECEQLRVWILRVLNATELYILKYLSATFCYVYFTIIKTTTTKVGFIHFPKVTVCLFLPFFKCY